MKGYLDQLQCKSSRLWAFLFEIRFYWVLGTGFVAWIFPQPTYAMPWSVLIVLALVEEAVFRAGLQYCLNHWFKNKYIFPGLSYANLLVALVFVCAHLVHHPQFWAVLTFFPSLIFGWAWDRYSNLLPCWLLHFFYNFLYFNRI